MLPPYIQIVAAIDCTKHTLFGLVPWYQYLTLSPYTIDDSSGHPISQTCRIINFSNMPSDKVLGTGSPFLLIGLAILEDLIRVAALVAVGYIIYGGFQYITSQGAPDVTKKAQTTIINALVGVVITIVAASGVAYIGHTLSK